MSDQVFILAAGIGQRFSDSTHKSLYPFYYGEGTLSKLLRQLAGHVPCENICVVTGNQAEKVTEVVSNISSSISIVLNTHYANGSSVTSLRAGIQSLVSNKTTKGVWVLFADSIYSEESIRTIFERTPASLTLATCPRSPQLYDAIGVDFNIEGKVSDLGLHCSNSMHVMVPAIYWPAATFETVLSQEAETARHQWEILQRLVDDNVTALPLPTDSILDIDTKADLCALRHQMLGGEVQKYFSSNICKEERSRNYPDRRTAQHFVKTCQSEWHAHIEASSTHWISKQTTECIVPGHVTRTGRVIAMEYVDGIRLFDLLRLLRQLSDQADETATLANNAAVTLMERSLNRLSVIQNALMTWSIRPSLDPYPIKSHLTELMQIVRRLLCLPQLPSQALVELAEFEHIWVTKDAVIPFRDATPKNILIGIPELASAKHSDEIGRFASLRAWLKHGNPSTVRIVDYDFTSTEHLTAPEDDLISLLAHHGALDVGRKILSHYDQPWHLALCNLPRDLGLPFSPDSERMARSLIVRYFRFGGRKLLYRAVNPSGFAMRFQNDSPVYYFRVLPSLVSDLDPDFQRRWPELFRSLQDISMCISRLPEWNDIELEHDDFKRFSADGLTYWRESPVEFAKVGSL